MSSLSEQIAQRLTFKSIEDYRTFQDLLSQYILVRLAEEVDDKTIAAIPESLSPEQLAGYFQSNVPNFDSKLHAYTDDFITETHGQF
jgi:hypothetical protein